MWLGQSVCNLGGGRTSAYDPLSGGFLSFARLIGRVHIGSDLQRFIVASSYLMYVFTNYSAE
ncbi:hypothetical protein CCGE525_01940 [Rhizobium jaguaris]|uniref:Uncharacterized protein n=1 Tax=Rhizobium jaguaris TaxID=1312183 RepID=A0A387FR26_9HYPH|nr:hypothetical protein CCGE525_01940 [Rhizobium jaguaris]